jgi:hypothetical protein
LDRGLHDPLQLFQALQHPVLGHTFILPPFLPLAGEGVLYSLP